MIFQFTWLHFFHKIDFFPLRDCFFIDEIRILFFCCLFSYEIHGFILGDYTDDFPRLFRSLFLFWKYARLSFHIQFFKQDHNFLDNNFFLLNTICNENYRDSAFLQCIATIEYRNTKYI